MLPTLIIVNTKWEWKGTYICTHTYNSKEGLKRANDTHVVRTEKYGYLNPLHIKY